MKIGDSLTSQDGNATLNLLGNGDLAVYYKGKRVYTVASGVYQLRQQEDGNLVAYTKTGHALWSIGDGAARKLYITNDGNLAYRTSSSDTGITVANWQATNNDRGHELGANQVLFQNQVIYSDNQLYRFVLQGDGNLVQYGSHGAVWATGNNRGSYLVQQSDGKLVLYDYTGKAIWSSPVWVTNGQSSRTVVQGDGNFVTYDGYLPLWALR